MAEDIYYIETDIEPKWADDAVSWEPVEYDPFNMAEYSNDPFGAVDISQRDMYLPDRINQVQDLIYKGERTPALEYIPRSPYTNPTAYLTDPEAGTYRMGSGPPRGTAWREGPFYPAAPPNRQVPMNTYMPTLPTYPKRTGDRVIPVTQEDIERARNTFQAIPTNFLESW